MSFGTKLIIFWLLLFATTWLIYKHPTDRLSKLANYWYGPTPRENENLSSFSLRQSLHAFKWALQTALVMIGIYLLGLWMPELNHSNLYMASIFATILLGGTFLLATLVYICQAAKQRWIGPNPLALDQNNEDNTDK